MVVVAPLRKTFFSKIVFVVNKHTLSTLLLYVIIELIALGTENCSRICCISCYMDIFGAQRGDQYVKFS